MTPPSEHGAFLESSAKSAFRQFARERSPLTGKRPRRTEAICLCLSKPGSKKFAMLTLYEL
jgi:hypothetical protein